MSSPNPYPPPGSPPPDPSKGGLAGMTTPEAGHSATEAVAYVFVPTHPSSQTSGDGRRQVQFELRQLEDGTGGLPVFTELGLLTEQLGEFQPWERVAVLELLVQVSTARLPVVVNPVVQDGMDRWTADTVEAWRKDIR